MLHKEWFTFVEYNGIPYPQGYSSQIREIAAHFDKEDIEEAEKYSLHTEYSYGKRKFNTDQIQQYSELKQAHRENVPQLWKSIEWAGEFADFIIGLTADRNPPSVIEIHPPFDDYCTMEEFVERFKCFEQKIHATYPKVEILMENRSGTVYRGGKFLIGRACEIVEFCKLIEKHQLRLGIVLDFPQLLTAENINPSKFNIEKYQSAIRSIAEYSKYIKGIHIWGKRKSDSGRWIAHCGNLQTYFSNA